MLCSLFILRPARRLFLGLGIAAAGLLGACSSGGSSDAENAATAQNKQKIDEANVTDKQEADAQFLVKATSNALLEVELGKLVQTRATLPAARAFGAGIVQNRLELLAGLRALAANKKLTLPPALGDDAQAAYHEVSTLAGTQLDKRAMALLVKSQKQDENAFDDMKDDAYDGDIRGLAAKYYTPVKEQLASAKEVADAVDKLP